MFRIASVLCSIFLILTSFSLQADAPEVESNAFYVDGKNGSDSNDGKASEEGGEGPWRTIQHAASMLAGGQVVYIREGIYSEPGPVEGSTKYWGIRPMNDGIPGERNRFLAYPGESVVVDMEFKAPCFVLYGREHIEISGLEIRNCSGSGVWVMGGSGRVNSDILISKNLIHSVDGPPGINAAAVRMDEVSDSQIQDNVMHNIRVDNAHDGNAAGVLSYGMYNVTINNNEIYDAFSGIFHKVPDYEGRKGGVFEKNVIHDVSNAFYFNTNTSVPKEGVHFNTEIRNNVVYSVSSFLFGNTHQSLGQNTGLKIVNNTVDGGELILRGFSDVEIYNNIFFKFGGIITQYTQEVLDNPDTRKTPSIAYSDFNLYYPNFYGEIGQYSGNVLKVTSLSQWQKIGYEGNPLTVEVSAPGPGQHSWELDPLFIDREARDYRPRPDSPVGSLGKGNDFIGAYTTAVNKIGPRSESETFPPEAPKLGIQ